MSGTTKLTRNRLHKACCDPLNAINWALDSGCCEGAERAFLADWRCGDFGEWGDYVEWVRRIEAGRAALSDLERLP